MPGTQSVMSSGHDLEVSTEEGELQSAGLVRSFCYQAGPAVAAGQIYNTFYKLFLSLS